MKLLSLKSWVDAAHKVLAVEPCLPALEAILLRNAPREFPAPVFVIGAPRTGTTVLYDFLTSSFESAYLTNAAALLFRSPMLATRLFSPGLAPRRFRGRSRMGYVPGVRAPSEAGALNRFWFADEGVPAPPAARIRAFVGALSARLGGSLVIKNVYNSFRLPRILEVFPEAIFVLVRRDVRFAAQSLLLARRELYGSDEEWFSLKPPEYDEVRDLPPIDQVVRQVLCIERHILDARRQLGISRFMTVRYEEFCRSPQTVAERMAEGFRGWGARLEPVTNLSSCTESIRSSDRPRLESAEWQSLVETTARYSTPMPGEAPS